MEIPVKKDKAFLFLSHEGNRLQESFNYLYNTPPVNEVVYVKAEFRDQRASVVFWSRAPSPWRRVSIGASTP